MTILDKKIEQLMLSNTLNLDCVNYFLQESNEGNFSKEDKKRFFEIVKDKLHELNFPLIKEFLIYINNEYLSSPFLMIDSIELIDDVATAILIKGRDKNNNQIYHLISEEYNRADSYDAFMYDGMFYENPAVISEEATSEDMANYGKLIDKVYGEYAKIVNKAFSRLKKEITVTQCQDGDGIFDITEGLGDVYICQRICPSDATHRYTNMIDGGLFRFIYIDNENNASRISAIMLNGELFPDEVTKFDSLLLPRKCESYLDGWRKEKMDYYINGLKNIRSTAFDLNAFIQFIWDIHTPPYVTQHDYHYKRPLDIATEKLIQLLDIPYEEANGYIQSLNKSVLNYSKEVMVGVDYPEFLPKQKLSNRLEEENTTFIKLLNNR